MVKGNPKKKVIDFVRTVNSKTKVCKSDTTIWSHGICTVKKIR